MITDKGHVNTMNKNLTLLKIKIKQNVITFYVTVVLDSHLKE